MDNHTGRISRRRAARVVLAMGTSLAWCGPALAQEQPPTAQPEAASASGDIVVTATRRGERLSRVPASIVALDQTTMDKQGVRTIADIARLSPGLNIGAPGSAANDVTGSRTTIAIRGISSTQGAATTGIYINDTPIQARATGNISSTAFPQIFDLERVEVLRGPQGTLFGAGAQGGAVRFITPAPDFSRISGYGRAEIAGTEGGGLSYEGGAAVGVPIVEDRLAVRLSGWYRHDGGWIDRVDVPTNRIVDENVNSINSWTARGALAWQPVDGLTLTLGAFHQDRKSRNPSQMFRNISDLDEGKFYSGRVLNQPLHDRFTLPTLDVKYEFGNGYSIVSNTSFFIRDLRFDGDYTNYVGAVLLGNPFPIISPQYDIVRIDERQRSFTQEVRIQSDPTARFSWLIGGYYGNLRQDTLQVNYDPTLEAALQARFGRGVVGVLGSPLLPGDVAAYANLETRDRQLAGFGQATLEIVDGLKLSAGARVARAIFDSDRVDSGPFNGPTPRITIGRQEETPVTPKFTASWQVDPNNLLYVSAAKGYRTGGVNSALAAFCQPELQGLGLSGDLSTYKSDTLWSYEAGTKSRLLGGQLTVSASVFHIKWKDVQQRVQLTSCGSGLTANLGTATSNGFDLSLEARPSDRLTVGANVGYADARLDQTLSGSPTAILARAGDRIGGPPWTVALSGQYDVNILGDRDGYARLDGQYVSESPFRPQRVVGADPTILRLSDSYVQLSARAGLRIGQADVSVFVDNLLDEAPTLSTSRDTTRSPLYFITSLRPRTFGLTGTFRY